MAEQSGLAECREMDAQLAIVAVAKLEDLPKPLLDEVFLSLDFFKLLVVRRVSKEWHRGISRESAPFLRHVAIAIDVVGLVHGKVLARMRVEQNYWQFAKKATAVLVFERPVDRINQRLRNDIVVQNVWAAYKEQVRAEGRAWLIDRVTYGSMTLSSGVLCCHFQIDFQTTLYHTELVLGVHELFCYVPEVFNDTEQPTRFRSATAFDDSSVSVRVQNCDSMVVSVRDVESVPPDMRRFFINPVAVHFAVRHARPIGATDLSNAAASFQAKYDGEQELRDFLKKLLKRCDPRIGTDQLESPISISAIISEYVTKLHPLASVLLYHFTRMDEPKPEQAGWTDDMFFDFDEERSKMFDWSTIDMSIIEEAFENADLDDDNDAEYF